MKNRIVTIIGLFALLSTASAAGPKADFNVIPVPRTICAGTSAPFVLDSNTKIYYEEGQKRNAAFLQQYITDITGIVPELTDRPRKRGTISLRVKDTSSDAEGYTLTVDKKNIHIVGNSPAGVFYAIQTLRKALPAGQASEVEIPSCIVEDSPRFAYRGVHLDVVRHFFPVDSVKRYIDIIALHNVNRFHWHLTDDQGWRVEIKSRPRLTSVGAYRKQTAGDGTPHGGFYTQDEIRDIIRYNHYSRDRHSRTLCSGIGVISRDRMHRWPL